MAITHRGIEYSITRAIVGYEVTANGKIVFESRTLVEAQDFIIEQTRSEPDGGQVTNKMEDK